MQKLNPEVTPEILEATDAIARSIEDTIVSRGLRRYTTLEVGNEDVRFSRERAEVRYRPMLTDDDGNFDVLGEWQSVSFQHRIALAPFSQVSVQRRLNAGSGREFIAVEDAGILRQFDYGHERTVSSPLGGVMLSRFLDLEETQALKRFTDDPARNVDELKALFQTNDLEEQRLAVAAAEEERSQNEMRAFQRGQAAQDAAAMQAVRARREARYTSGAVPRPSRRTRVR